MHLLPDASDIEACICGSLQTYFLNQWYGECNSGQR